MFYRVLDTPGHVLLMVESKGQVKRRRKVWNAVFVDESAGWGKLLIIDVDNINFVDNPEDLGTIFNRIDAELNGLF